MYAHSTVLESCGDLLLPAAPARRRSLTFAWLRRARLRCARWWSLTGNIACLRLVVARQLLRVFVAEQCERREAAVERENHPTSIDLSDFPAADVVADLYAISLRCSRANQSTRTFIVHHDANQRQVGRLRYDRDRSLLGRRWRRRWCWATGGREQGTIARRRQAIERLRFQRI